MLRALKISRSNSITKSKNENDPVNVKLEIEALSLVNHQNVTRFYGGKIFDSGHYVIVTQLVENQQTLSEWLNNIIKVDAAESITPDVIDKTKSAKSIWNASAIHDVLIKVAEKLHGCALALKYMHDVCQLYHMDVKPGNLLVGSDGIPYVADLGFARCKKKYVPNQMVPVGFTFGFHHPDLEKKYKMLLPESVNKAWSVVPVNELDSRFDLYAFGRTILYLLKQFENRFGERAHSQYAFSYLHLVGALLLDARNVDSPTEHFANEMALGVELNLLQTFHLKCFDQVIDRLERFLGMRPIECRVPELDRWQPKTLNHGIGSLTVTNRLTSIIEHPALRRLKKIPQLSTAVEVYPGATHTRYAHCLGVTGVICECLCALYNDPENPIFKVLVEDSEIKAMIVAGVVHDIGQSEYGHELEEVDEDVYSHKKVAQHIFDNDKYLDRSGRSLRNIVEGKGFDEWNVPWSSVESIIGMSSVPPRIIAFQNILNSPIDADKIDYLCRDSANCNVPYSKGLDIHRLMKCITITPDESNEGFRYLKLAVKEKGLASSTAVTLARHQMYQSVYLHHTARDLKAIVMTACAQAHLKIMDSVKQTIGAIFQNDANMIISNMFAAHITNQVAAFKFKNCELETPRIKKDLEAIWKKVVNGHKECASDGFEFDRSLTFFYGFLDSKSKELFKDYADRRIYKRIFAVSYASLSSEKLRKLKEKLSWSNRSATLTLFKNELKNRARKILEGGQASFLTINKNPNQAIVVLEEAEHDIIVADLPLRELGPGGSPPPVLHDISRKRGNYKTRETSRDGLGHIWKSGMEIMMAEISICHLFCQPEFAEIIEATLKQPTIGVIAANILWDEPMPSEEKLNATN
jgi:HD superfamily phosphohydrolase